MNIIRKSARSDEVNSEIREEIIKKYRRNDSNFSEFPTLNEFVDYLVDNKDFIKRYDVGQFDVLNVLFNESCISN